MTANGRTGPRQLLDQTFEHHDFKPLMLRSWRHQLSPTTDIDERYVTMRGGREIYSRLAIIGLFLGLNLFLPP